MRNETINSLKKDYELETLPPETESWSARLLNPSLWNTVTEPVYCPYCEYTSQNRTAPTDEHTGNVICPNCNETIQHFCWDDGEPEELDQRVFHCPNECSDRSIAACVEIKKLDGYYTAICTNCNAMCNEGRTRDAHQYEQLQQILEAELNGTFEAAENVTMTSTIEVNY